MVVNDGGPVVVAESAAIAAGEELLFGLNFGALGLNANLSVVESSSFEDCVNRESIKRAQQQQQQNQDRLQAGIRDLLQLRDPSLLASHAIFQTSHTKDKALERLFAWATRTHGAELSGVYAGQDVYGGRGLFSSHDTATAGLVLAVLPRSLRIGQKLACQRVAGGGLLPVGTPDLTAVSLLVLSFWKDALEMGDNDEGNCAVGGHDADNNPDNWGLYAQALPHSRKELNNAILASEQQVEECLRQFQNITEHQRESYRQASKSVRSTAECCVQYIRHVLLEEPYDEDTSPRKHHPMVTLSISSSSTNSIPIDSAIHWAIAIVMSRAHAFGSHLGSRWLTPILDLANHSPNPNCQLEGDSQGRLLLKALRPMARGDEITIDYQVDQDPKLLATYGFSLEHGIGL